MHWTFSAATLQILFMLKQQHYTLTNVKKVKSQSTTPLKAYCITVLKAVYYVEWSIMRERDVITCIWYSIHSSAQSHIHNKTLVWISAEESVIFVVLSFHLLRVISDGSASQCICCTYIRALDCNQNGCICDSFFFEKVQVKLTWSHLCECMVCAAPKHLLHAVCAAGPRNTVAGVRFHWSREERHFQWERFRGRAWFILATSAWAWRFWFSS